jgi:hypothetical protein
MSVIPVVFEAATSNVIVREHPAAAAAAAAPVSNVGILANLGTKLRSVAKAPERFRER